MQTRQSPPHVNPGGDPPSQSLVDGRPVGDPDKEKAFWTQADEEALVRFLIDVKASAGDGGNFKKTTWTAAAAHMRQFTSKGGPKTADSCKNKWNRVSYCYSAI